MAEEDHLQRAADSIKTAEDLYYFAKASSLLKENKEKRQSFLYSESFYRFAGVGAGAFVAAIVLVFTKFSSIATDNISLLQTNREELERRLGRLQAESAELGGALDVAKTALVSTNENLATAEEELAKLQDRIAC